MKNFNARASDEYVRYFGRIPDVGMIKCEGLVIYYPEKEGNSFVPYPFFVTTPENKERLIARTMIAGLPSRAMGAYVNPIYQGWGELEEISVTGKTLNIAIKSGITPKKEDLNDTARAFFITYKQFHGELENVILHAGSEGKVEVASPGITVQEPGPPVILDAFLVSHEGEGEAHELRILFDRPVMIQDLAIEKAGGKRMEGKIYLAEFSMAGIFEHGGDEAVEEGDTFTIRYAVHDYLGRKSEGKKSFTARVEVHSG
ncbi:MAG: hypothetical protein GTO08_08380 [Deltaproteobacteria bacterium]|nr:hypothetical protein [Deltaproteobacteria bacterium]